MKLPQLNFAAIWQIVKRDLAALTPLRVVEGVALLLIATQLTILGINSLNGGNPILGLRLQGHNVGQLGSTDFRKQANAIISARENKKLSIKVANKKSSITLRQLGENADEEQIYIKLLQTGRTGSVLNSLVDQNKAIFGGLDIGLDHSTFNKKLAKQYIATLDKKIDIPPTNAFFALKNKTAVIHSDANGRVIAVHSAINQILNADPESNPQINLPIRQTTARVTVDLLTPRLQQVKNIARKPLKIAAKTSHIKLSRAKLISLIVPKIIPHPKDPKKVVARISFDEAKLKALVDRVVKQAEVAPKPTIVSNGQVIQKGRSGLQSEGNRSVVKVLKSLIQRQNNISSPSVVKIPLIKVKPPVIEQAEQATGPVGSGTGTGLVRLTFDDGPGAYTEQVLDILGRYNVHATFYVIGRNVQGYPQTMQRINNEGHAIGNHSFTHSDLSALSRAGVMQELADTQAAIRNACGVTATAFRPPYGALNSTVQDVAASLGLSVDLWSVDPQDWAQPGSSAITQRVLSGTGPGAVVLLHTLNQQTVDALPSIIEGIRAQGYTLE